MEAIFAYIPVVHTGTLSLLKSHDVPLLLLDNEEAKKENVYLERDIRALKAVDIEKELRAHGFDQVTIVTPASLTHEFQKYEALIIPQDEIVDFFLEKYAPTMPVKRVETFLRWTKQISSVEHEVPPDRTITTDAFARDMMTTLEGEAAKSEDWWRQIGAAIIKDGKVLVVAHNKHHPSAHTLTLNGDPRSNFDAGQGAGIYTSIHAEACALSYAAKEGIATDKADAFVTTFPCPSCARALLEAGIMRVFYKKGYSLLDAEEILRGAGVEIILVKD
jgi:dCMP deaminase